MERTVTWIRRRPTRFVHGCSSPLLGGALILFLIASTDCADALTGAQRMPPESFRFVAYVGDGYGYCTGAIIAPTWVLTAAHCVVKGDGSTIGPDEINDLSRGWPDDDWEKMPVKRVISHPDYYWQGDGFRNDVALLETVRPFVSSDMVPVEVLGLEDEGLYAANGTTAVMVGYGEDENGQRDRDGLFKIVSAPLHHADSCRVKHSFVDAKGEIVHDRTICAGDRARGIRDGDSGGPLLVRTDDDGAYGLVGIASISGHDPSGYPVVAVYTRVAAVKNWIDGCVLGTAECVEGGVRLKALKRHAPDAIRESETLVQRSTAIVFVNDTERGFSYNWVDFNGDERYYGSVGPGESVSQHTYPGHVWAVKDDGGRTFAIFVAEREMGRAIVSGDVRPVIDDRDGGDDVEDVRVADGTDSAWVMLEIAGLGWVHGETTDSGTSNLNDKTTPGTWGASAWLTIGKPFLYGGAWAVYRADDGTVIQVAVFGNADYDPTYSGAAWRVHRASGWSDWKYGTGQGRMGIALPSALAGSVRIAQAGQLSLPFPLGREEWRGKSEREWNSTSVLLIHDDMTGSQIAVSCYLPCLAWQRASTLAIAAVETDDTSVHDDEAATTETDSFPDFSSDRITEVLDEALTATTWNVHGDEVPDWTTRLRALELVLEVYGTKVERSELPGVSVEQVVESEPPYVMTRAVFDQLCSHVRSGNHEQIDRMVQAGADLNRRFGDDTAVYCAQSPQTLAYLVEEHEADPDGRIQDGEHLDTPLCKARTLEMAKELVRLGAVVQARGDDSQTLLVCAVYYGNDDLVEWAVNDLQVDIHKPNEDGTPLCIAEKYRRDQIATLLRLGADPKRAC